MERRKGFLVHVRCGAAECYFLTQREISLSIEDPICVRSIAIAAAPNTPFSLHKWHLMSSSSLPLSRSEWKVIPLTRKREKRGHFLRTKSRLIGLNHNAKGEDHYSPLPYPTTARINTSHSFFVPRKKRTVSLCLSPLLDGCPAFSAPLRAILHQVCALVTQRRGISGFGERMRRVSALLLLLLLDHLPPSPSIYSRSDT